MAFIKKKSVLPIYLVGVTWLVWAIFLPLYRPTHYIMAALVSAIVYFVGKMIWPDRGFTLDDGTTLAFAEDGALTVGNGG